MHKKRKVKVGMRNLQLLSGLFSTTATRRPFLTAKSTKFEFGASTDLKLTLKIVCTGNYTALNEG